MHVYIAENLVYAVQQDLPIEDSIAGYFIVTKTEVSV